jgi:small-conductance mechanosensitive channel
MFRLRRTGFYLLITALAGSALFFPQLIPDSYRPDQVATASVQIKVLFGAFAFLGLLIPSLVTRLLAARLLSLINRHYVTIHRLLKFQRFEMVSEEGVRDRLCALAQSGRHMVELLLWGVFLSRILTLFPEARPLGHDLQLMIVAPLATIGLAIVDYLPNLAQIAVVLLVTRYALKVIHLFFHAIGAGIIVLPDFYPEWAEPTYKITRMLVFIFIPFMIMPLLPGADSRFFEEITFFIGLLVSFGSTSAIKNMTAGIVLTYTRSFQIGDRVCIGNVTGDVTEKSLFVTRIDSIKNEQIALPNATVLESNIVNYSSLADSKGLILHTSVTIGYDVDWRHVQSLLIDAALATPDIQHDPRPFVLQTSLDNYYVAYEINAYTDQPHHIVTLLSRLNQNILDTFHAAGVEIMSPSYSALRNGNDVAIPLQRYDPRSRSQSCHPLFGTSSRLQSGVTLPTHELDNHRL